MRTIVIGDVHGMLEELRALVDKLNPGADDRLFFLGDLVDKGPDSLGVLRFVRDLGASVVCGNHEESALRLFDKATKAGTWDGIKKADKEPWLRDLTPDLVDWMRTFPLFIRPLDGVLLVHGGLLPAYFDHYDALPSASPEAWHKGGGKTVDRMRRMLRIRHVYRPGATTDKGKDCSGQMVELGNEGENTQHWGDWYDGREGFAIYGHDPQRQGVPCLHSHAMALDTGAVFGGRLTAAILDREDLEPGRTNMHVLAGGQRLRIHFESVEGRAFHDWLNLGE